MVVTAAVKHMFRCGRKNGHDFIKHPWRHIVCELFGIQWAMLNTDYEVNIAVRRCSRYNFADPHCLSSRRVVRVDYHEQHSSGLIGIIVGGSTFDSLIFQIAVVTVMTVIETKVGIA